MAAYVIGVDVGYGNTKTSHTCFSSGVKKLPGKPPLSTRVIETTDGFYAIGNGKVSIQKSKTEDESMRVLTMAAIAEELKKIGQLKEQGIITEEEFAKMKADCLAKIR